MSILKSSQRATSNLASILDSTRPISSRSKVRPRAHYHKVNRPFLWRTSKSHFHFKYFWVLLPDHASTSITPAVSIGNTVLLHNFGVFGKERVISTTKQEHFSPQRPSILENFASMDDSWRQNKDLRQHYCVVLHVGSSFWCRPNIAFPNKRLPTRSFSSKVSMALARSWKSLSSFESIPGMLCIACLGREWQNDPANHANLTLLPPNRSSFLDPNEFGPNFYRKSWTARARVTTSLMVQDTTSRQLLSASYLALGEDPQRQNVSGFCTNTKRHRRVNGKVAVSLKISTISNPNTTSSYWSLSWKARQIYLASHQTNKSQQRSQKWQNLSTASVCQVSRSSPFRSERIAGSSVPLIHNASGRFHRRS